MPKYDMGRDGLQRWVAHNRTRAQHRTKPRRRAGQEGEHDGEPRTGKGLEVDEIYLEGVRKNAYTHAEVL